MNIVVAFHRGKKGKERWGEEKGKEGGKNDDNDDEKRLEESEEEKVNALSWHVLDLLIHLLVANRLGVEHSFFSSFGLFFSLLLTFSLLVVEKIFAVMGCCINKKDCHYCGVTKNLFSIARWPWKSKSLRIFVLVFPQVFLFFFV